MPREAQWLCENMYLNSSPQAKENMSIKIKWIFKHLNETGRRTWEGGSLVVTHDCSKALIDSSTDMFLKCHSAWKAGGRARISPKRMALLSSLSNWVRELYDFHWQTLGWMYCTHPLSLCRTWALSLLDKREIRLSYPCSWSLSPSRPSWQNSFGQDTLPGLSSLAKWLHVPHLP
jgi:hypothetical protein